MSKIRLHKPSNLKILYNLVMLQFKNKQIDEYLTDLSATLKNCKSIDELYGSIVNAPFKNKQISIPFGLGIVVLLLVNKKSNTLDRIALSDTEPARGAVDYSVKPFHEINIPLSATPNILIRTLLTKRWHQTDDWEYLFTPILTGEEARFNQAGAGIGCSIAYPLDYKDGGVLIFSYFKHVWEIEEIHHRFMQKYSDSVSHAIRKISS